MKINRQIFQKPKDQDFTFAWYVQRKISGFAAVLLQNTFITPNHITFLSIIVGLCSFYFFYHGGAVNDLKGILLYQLSFLLDCLDGDLARLRGNNKVKLGGMYIDYIRALLLEPLLPVFLAVGLLMNGCSEYIVIFLGVASFWRWIPKFAKEHIVIRQLPRNRELLETPQFFEDMSKGIDEIRSTLLGYFSKTVLIFWGLPIGLMNTITILAFTGVFLISHGLYHNIKFIYLILLTVFYYLHFFNAALKKYKLLNNFWKS